MHDCPVAAGDAFLAGFIPRIIDAPDWGPNDLLVVTFDEGHTGDQPSARSSSRTRARRASGQSVRHDHYSLLRTLEASWGLGCLGNACTANDLAEFFSPGGPAAVVVTVPVPRARRSGDGPAAPGIERRGP